MKADKENTTGITNGKSFYSVLRKHMTLEKNSVEHIQLICSLWYDWGWKHTTLHTKGCKLLNKAQQIAMSPKIDINNTYVFFKNNCPLYGSLYDDFRICDIVSGDVIYTVVPSIGQSGGNKSKAAVYGRENGFHEPLAIGKWSDVVAFFMSPDIAQLDRAAHFSSDATVQVQA